MGAALTMKQPMYARVTLAQVRPGELQKTMGLLRDTLYPAFELMEGFQGAFLLANPVAEKVCGITLWESEDLIPRVTRTSTEAAGRATRRFFEVPPLEQLATIPLAGQPGREVYRVAAPARRASVARFGPRQVTDGPGRAWRHGPGRRNCPRPGPGRRRETARVHVLPCAHPSRQRAISWLFTLWESEAHALDWETGCQSRRLISRMTPLLDGQPELDPYDVSVCL